MNIINSSVGTDGAKVKRGKTTQGKLYEDYLRQQTAGMASASPAPGQEQFATVYKTQNKETVGQTIRKPSTQSGASQNPSGGSTQNGTNGGCGSNAAAFDPTAVTGDAALYYQISGRDPNADTAQVRKRWNSFLRDPVDLSPRDDGQTQNERDAQDILGVGATYAYTGDPEDVGRQMQNELSTWTRRGGVTKIRRNDATQFDPYNYFPEADLYQSYDCKIKLFGRRLDGPEEQGTKCKILSRNEKVGARTMIKVLVGEDEYYLSPKALQGDPGPEEFWFWITRKDLIQVNGVLHGDYQEE